MATTPGKLVTLLVGETKKNWSGTPVSEMREGHSAPSYIGVLPMPELIETFTQSINGAETSFRVKGYSPNIIIIEGTREIADIFGEHVIDIKKQMLAASENVLARYDAYKGFEEEYGIFCVSQYKKQPEDEFRSRFPRIAGLIKSEKEPLDEREIHRTMESSMKYGKDDLLIADWDGAFVFNQSGGFVEAISLCELVNVQLLRYRILDFELDRRLRKLLRLLNDGHVRKFGIFRTKELKETIREIIQTRSHSLIEFEDVERNVKLIGDWYSAKVYSMLEKKFHIEEWRGHVKEKFEALGDVYTMASENFSLSFSKRMDIVLIFGWLFLLVGWFVLFVFDLLKFLRS